MYIYSNVCKQMTNVKSLCSNILNRLTVSKKRADSFKIVINKISYTFYIYCHVIAHGDEEVRLILSSRVELALSSSQKVTVRKECGSRRGDQVFALSDLRSPDIGRRKREKPNDWLGPQNGSGAPFPSAEVKDKKVSFWARLVADEP